MRIITSLLVLSSACVGGSSNGTPDAGPDTRPNGGVAGARGLAGFGGLMLGKGARPMAAGGAVTFLTAGLLPDAPSIAGLTSSDPSVFEVRSRDPLPARGAFAFVTTHHSGTADVILSDPSGAEIDRTALTVVDTNLLTADHGWVGAGPTILADTPVALHVTTEQRAAGHDTVLVGSGAVSFLGTGAITAEPRHTGDPSSDLGTLRGNVGDGTVRASCPTAQLEIPIHVVPVSALTAVAAPDSVSIVRTAGPLSVGGLAGATPVYGVVCTQWQTPAGVTVELPAHLCAVGPCTGDDALADLGRSSQLTYSISGPAGTYSLTCTIQGGLRKTIVVTLQ